MKLRNANPAAKATGVDELPGTSNYFIGNDPAKWRTNVPTYAKVKYEGIYSGIDLVYYGNQRQLEYDFIVAPGADPRRIAFDVSGAKQIRRDAHGDLVLKVEAGQAEIRFHKPVVYQEKDGARREIAARYAITAANRVGFALAEYDATRPLYIDPLIYSTYLGGSRGDNGSGIAVDSAGNAYVTGWTSSPDFPTTPGAFQATEPVPDGGPYRYDAFVSKLNPAGSALVYSTYLGGSGPDFGYSIVVDSAGDAYVTGGTGSNDFPTTSGAFQTACGGNCGNFNQDAFVTKLNPAGSALVYSTYLGGSGGEHAAGIAVDGAGNAYVTGGTLSTDFPTMNPLQPANASIHGNAFVSKLNPAGSALVYSTYLGGSGDSGGGDGGSGIAVDKAGNAYVVGSTRSTDFPTMNPFQPAFGGGGSDAFVANLNSAGSALVYSTYLGGSGWDGGGGIALGSAGNAYVTGVTNSTDFPIKNPLQPSFDGGSDVFVSRLNPTGSALVYSTYLGGSGADYSYGIAVDSVGNAYVTGITDSTDFPTKNPLQPNNAGDEWDAFVSKLSPAGSALAYSTYLGGSRVDYGYGIAVDSTGGIYVTGETTSFDFPTRDPLQPIGYGTAIVAKISTAPSDVTLFPLHLDFGSQSMGIASSPRVSTLTNTGTATLTVTSVGIGGADSGDFAQTNDCGPSVPAGSSCSINVTFNPTVFGKRNASVAIADSATDSPQSISLTGFGKLDSSTQLISSLNPAPPGKGVKFTATVSSPSGGTPTGFVTFLDGGSALASKPLSGGKAAFSTIKLQLGLHVIAAVYGGDGTFGGSTSAPVNQYILPATTTTLSSSPNPSAYGQAVIFVAVVSSGTGAPPDGETVSFVKGTTVLGTGTLSGGSASFTTSTLPIGTNAINAVYGSDSNLAGSKSKALSQIVSNAATTTTLVSSLNPSKSGQSVTFTASVTPQFSGKVTGNVTFYDGTTLLKSVPLSGGVAKFTTKTLTSGTHSITATYNGSHNFDGSSASLTQTVD